MFFWTISFVDGSKASVEIKFIKASQQVQLLVFSQMIANPASDVSARLHHLQSLFRDRFPLALSGGSTLPRDLRTSETPTLFTWLV